MPRRGVAPLPTTRPPSLPSPATSFVRHRTEGAESDCVSAKPYARSPHSLPDFSSAANRTYQFKRSAACSCRGVLKISLFELSIPNVELCRVVEPVPKRTRLKRLNASMRKSRLTLSVSLILRFKERFSLKMGN